MKILDRKELEDLLTGCALYGTGGGGEFDAGWRYIELALSLGKQFKLAQLDELDSEDIVASPYALGCTEPTPRSESQKRLPTTEKLPIMSAIEALETHCQVSLTGTIACELGAENTAVAAFAAAMMDGVFLDADTAGRAVPEITHSTFSLNQLPISPIVLSNHFGETIVCEHVFDDERAEEIAREFAKISCNDIAAVDHPLPANQLKGNVIVGTLSRAILAGQILNDFAFDGEKACRTIADQCGGVYFFEGTIDSCDDHITNGFTTGRIKINGSGAYANDQCQILIKNENMSAQINGQTVVTIPELICVVDAATKRPLTNPNIVTGTHTIVLVLPAPEIFTTKKGLDVFGPSYLGLQQAFKPLCK